jgi:hypothetical protein
MYFFSQHGKKFMFQCQGNTSGAKKLFYWIKQRNILIGNKISNRMSITDQANVNNLFFMLIFIGVILYNVFIEYIFSSRFIIN